MASAPPSAMSRLRSRSRASASVTAGTPRSAARSASSTDSSAAASRGRRHRGRRLDRGVEGLPRAGKPAAKAIEEPQLELLVEAGAGVQAVAGGDGRDAPAVERDHEVVAVPERREHHRPVVVAPHERADVAGVEAARGARGHAQQDPLVGADQARALAEVARPDHDLALDVEQESGPRARDAGEECFEDAPIGQGDLLRQRFEYSDIYLPML